MAASGSKILGSDYNAVVLKLIRVLGSGAPDGPGSAGTVTYGYNQALTAANVAVGSTVDAAEWSKLLSDINKCYLHQNGSSYAFPSLTSGTKILGDHLDDANTVMNGCTTNRLNVAAGQLTQSTLITNGYDSAWGGAGNKGIQTTASVTWSSYANMQYFFNQGGQIVIQGKPTNGTTTVQDQRWNAALNASTYTIGMTEFNALTTTAVQRFYYNSFPAPYASNYIQILASKNSTTAPTAINLTIKLQDVHAATGAGPDTVSAGAGFYMYQKNASGAFTGTASSSNSGIVAWTIT